MTYPSRRKFLGGAAAITSTAAAFPANASAFDFMLKREAPPQSDQALAKPFTMTIGVGYRLYYSL